MEANLAKLANKLGIACHFSDAGLKKREYEVSEKVVRFFCHCFGYSADTPEQAALSLQKLEEKQWKTTLDNMFVCRRSNLKFIINLKKTQIEQDMQFSVSKMGSKDIIPLQIQMNFTGEEKKIGNFVFQQFEVKIQSDLEYGYYNLEFVCGKNSYHAVLASVPDKCYASEDVKNGKLWGFSVQLYSVKSRRNWGVGDFTDLKNMVKICADSGADVIGLNPLNVLSHDFPENASPYSSISRLFLNPIYIDVEQTYGFSNDIIANLPTRIAEVKSSELIDYKGVYNLKIEALQKLFDNLDKSSDYYAKFENFKHEKGADLDLLAAYQALYHEQCQTVWGGCCAWEKNLQNPQSLQVERFKQAHTQEIEFFKFLQFEAERQLQTVYAEVKKYKLKIGLYRDLPVGVSKDSAEFWAGRSTFIEKAGAGAPPDAFFPCGQKWCLGAFNPFELKSRTYEPFLKILRANMAYAGALRIDHVMSLMRLFMIPDNQDEGTYIYYNFDDMLGLLALESYLHKCAVVGESIGNVPDGFLEKLKEHNLYAISVMWSERWNSGCGDFKMPRDYPEDAFVSVGTHDMPPLKMWWFGYEIELMYKLKMMTEDGRINAYKQREADRRMLLAAMDFNQVWPQDNLRKADYLYGEGYPEGLEEAAHKLLAQTPAKVVMLQPEDVFQSDVLQNLPGTDRDKYPNWYHRLPVDLEDFENLQAFWRNVNAVKSTRNTNR